MNKIFLVGLILSVSLCQQRTVIDRLQGTQVVEEGEKETIYNIHYFEDENPKEKYEQLMSNLLNLNQTQLLSCRKSESHEFFGMSFQNVGRLNHELKNIKLKEYDDDCFSQMRVSYEYNDAENQVQVTFDPGDYKNGKQCSEFYMIGTTLNYNIVKVKKVQNHKVYFHFRNEKQKEAFKLVGAYIFRTCDHFDYWIGDLLTTIELFFGGFSANPFLGSVFGSVPPDWMVRSNIEFIERATGFRWKERPNVDVEWSEAEIHQGDFLAITRFDGLDQIIEWGTGSRSGHSAVIFEIDGVKWVVESQDAWYWPKKNIQKNRWEDWKVYAKNAGFNVAILPLSPEKRAQWNQEGALKFWNFMEGCPYGYHNFIFGWIDTPKDNYPSLLSAELATYIFSFIEKFAPSISNKMVGEGLNKRLGTEGLTIPEITIEAAKRGIEIAELYAMVEKDNWIYSDGPSQVCSSFVIGLYKAAGLFGEYHIEATEFTPKDVYQMNFFDKNYVVPKKCKDNDPDLPYCQIMGTHRMELEGYNTIDPYEHMNERCPSQAPDYKRPADC
ncbi:unnamed protein product (macronuclear) [Paramecium tetraurelia]|uniref:Peptidase C51 domain-containing protein n=1 Tax=Paramecium tetraurelia TaxID=5888 RepID=A0CDJ5_PARTE|nr:uncharacterized protein GSPATT00007073001 [Paramecium tetraurelia]CAK68862.1 unnamed protein product [Paramecium tetraurelia]|eukprot:XP_001436259.1 hypothetical protein (macronuclear) [Paramecium tetraurelia strain d4-2]